MSARILVVDDEANIRALIDEILSEEGYDVTTAADAKHARAARKEHEFDLAPWVSHVTDCAIGRSAKDDLSTRAAATGCIDTGCRLCP